VLDLVSCFQVEVTLCLYYDMSYSDWIR